MSSNLYTDTITKSTAAGLVLVNPAFQGYCGLTALKTASYAILDTDNYSRIECDTTAGDVTITLPLKSTNVGRIIQIANVKGGTNKVIISPNATDANKLSNDGLNAIWLPKIGNYVVFQESANSGFWEIVNERISSQLRLDTYAGYGSTDTKIMQFTNIDDNYGNMFTHNHGSYGVHGLDITIARSGKYSFSFSHYFPGSDYFGFTLNSAQLTTGILSVTIGTILAIAGSDNIAGCASWSGYLVKGSIVRPHTNGGTGATHIVTATYIGS